MTTRFYIDLEVLARDTSRGQMEDMFEPLADALYDLSDVIDADLGMDAGKRTFEFSMAIDANTDRDALQIALNAVRTALHCIGVHTPGWESLFEIIRRTVWNEPSGNLINA